MDQTRKLTKLTVTEGCENAELTISRTPKLVIDVLLDVEKLRTDPVSKSS